MARVLHCRDSNSGCPGFRVGQSSLSALFSSTDTQAYHVSGLDLGAGGTGANKSDKNNPKEPKNPALVEAHGNGIVLYLSWW